MPVLRSMIFNIVFYGATGILSVVLLPALITRPTTHAIAKWWSELGIDLAKWICGIHYRIEGSEHMPPPGTPVIIASKHQSAWDTLIYTCLLDRPAYVLKKQLIAIPLFGLYLWRIGSIAIDRTAGGSAIRQIVRQGKKIVEQGRPIIIYPEGTRTPPGMRREYQPGVAALYSQLEVPVIPVALNSGICWGRQAFFKRPGTITLTFLPPIAPGLKRQEFMAALENAIESKTAELTAT